MADLGDILFRSAFPALGPTIDGIRELVQKAGFSLSPNPTVSEVSNLISNMQAARRSFVSIQAVWPDSPAGVWIATVDKAISQLTGLKSKIEAQGGSLVNFSPSLKFGLDFDFDNLNKAAGQINEASRNVSLAIGAVAVAGLFLGSRALK